MRRRDFIKVIAGSVAAWPVAARAQQPERMRRIGVIVNMTADDSEGQVRNAAFLQALQELGWTVGRNVQIDYRWTSADPDRIRKSVAELVALEPDVIQATSSPVTAALLQATRTVPIVFVQVADPVGSGLVESLARPGGNATGFSRRGLRRSTSTSNLPFDLRQPMIKIIYHRSGVRCDTGSVAAIDDDTGAEGRLVAVRQRRDSQAG
jgi:ABC-type uncharacterized transport system substrate-binding protein